MDSPQPVAAERLKCLLTYFHHIVQNGAGEGHVTIERHTDADRNSHGPVFWLQQHIPVGKVDITHTECIEDVVGAVHLDFANRDLLRGDSTPTATQEEILFSIRPELYLTLLTVDRLQDGEVAVVRGARRFAEYTGYHESFRYARPSQVTDATVLVMDAYMNVGTGQYRTAAVLRDTNKARLGFERCGPAGQPVATGNWGCGAFDCDQDHKFLQQAMAAAVARRPLHYCARQPETAARLQALHALIAGAQTPVSTLFRLVDTEAPLFRTRGTYGRWLEAELQRHAGQPFEEVGLEVSADEAKALRLLEEAEVLENAGDCLGAMACYRKAYRLCPRLEQEG